MYLTNYNIISRVITHSQSHIHPLPREGIKGRGRGLHLIVSLRHPSVHSLGGVADVQAMHPAAVHLQEHLVKVNVCHNVCKHLLSHLSAAHVNISCLAAHVLRCRRTSYLIIQHRRAVTACYAYYAEAPSQWFQHIDTEALQRLYVLYAGCVVYAILNGGGRACKLRQAEVLA